MYTAKVKRFKTWKGLKTRACTNCYMVFDVEHYSVITKKNGFQYPASLCKKCASKASYLSQMKSKLKKDPYTFAKCINELCGYIWKRRVYSNNGYNGKLIERNMCIKCNTHLGEY